MNRVVIHAWKILKVCGIVRTTDPVDASAAVRRVLRTTQIGGLWSGLEHVN